MSKGFESALFILFTAGVLFALANIFVSYAASSHERNSNPYRTLVGQLALALLLAWYFGWAGRPAPDEQWTAFFVILGVLGGAAIFGFSRSLRERAQGKEPGVAAHEMRRGLLSAGALVLIGAAGLGVLSGWVLATIWIYEALIPNLPGLAGAVLTVFLSLLILLIGQLGMIWLVTRLDSFS